MATTFSDYNAPATYSFTFPSYQSSDVKVRVDGVLKTEGNHYNITGYSTTGGGTVVFTSGNVPSSGVVRIYRDTNVDVAKATYTAGSSVKAADLNNNNTQLLYRAQEEQVPNLIQSYDIAASAIETSNIKADAITGAKIADDQINSEHYVDGSIDTQHIADSQITTAKIADGAVTRVKIANDAIDSTKLADNAVGSEHYQDGSIANDKLVNLTVTGAKIANATISTAKLEDSSVTTAKLAADAVTNAKIADDSIDSEHYVDGSIDEQHIANTAVTANKIADGTVGTLELANSAVTTAKLATNAVDATKLADNAVDTNAVQDDAITYSKIQNVSATDRVLGRDSSGAGVIQEIAPVQLRTMINVEDGATADQTASEIKTLLQSDKLTASEISSGTITSTQIATGTLDGRYFTETELTNGALDGRYFTETESDARYFNISSGETIKDGDTFPDNDTTIATTAAINDRIIDIVNDVGGFDIVESEQHFPNTNPQGQAGSAAVLSIKAASTNLVPSGTTVTIVNGNLANNANITITGVTSTIPSGFGFIVESTSTLHSYTFHRLVPKATEVTTVASNITNINNAANNETNINAAVSNASNINAAVSNASNINAAVSNASNINAAVSNASNINAAVSNASNITTTASNITNVNNVGNNVTNVNSVSNSAGANQTFTVTVQNVSGNKYFIDGVQTPVLKLARGKTYTFDMSDSSNSGHPLAFRDSSDNSYTTGVTTSGTAGSSGATVVIVVAANAPSSLKYYCTSHGNAMGNTITVIDDNVGIVAGSIANVNTTAGSIANVNTTAGSISNVNTVASNISSVNSFFNVYRIGSSNPTSSLDTGDLFFNTSTNSLKVYTGSAWVDGVTATGNFALKTGNTFTGSNIYNDNVKAIYGTGSDLEIFHNGSHSFIKDVGTGGLRITGSQINLQNSVASENMLSAAEDGAVQLFYDASTKLETTANGASITGRLDLSDNLDMPDNAKVVLGTGDDLKIYSDGSTVFFGGDDIRFRNKALDENMLTLSGNGSVVLFHNNTNRLQTDGNGITVQGNINMATDSTLQLGVGNDFKLFHNGTTNFIRSANGNIQIDNNSGVVNAKFIPAGATELYHNGSKKLETDSLGTIITGRVLFGDSSSANDHRIKFGDSGDLQLYHDGSHSFVDDTGTGHLNIRGNQINIKNTDDNLMLVASGGGATNLYHNGSRKLETTSTGTTTTGSSQVDNDVKFVSGARHKFVGSGTNNLELGTYSSSNSSRDVHMEITSGGKVGINQTTPTEMLHVKDDGNSDVFGGIIVQSNNESATVKYGWRGIDGNDNVRIATGGNERIRVDNVGNVGIGTTTPSGKLTVIGNITLGSGHTVDGRDVSADGTKLDGIESGATADQTASEILTLIKTVDGSGSGLDADTLDGISSASFLRSDTSDSFTALTCATTGTNDLINFTGADGSNNRGIAFNSKTALSASATDAWLRLNNNQEFSSGVYTPLVMRADGGFNVDGYTVVNGSGNLIASRLTGALPAIDGSSLTGINTDLVSDTSPQLGGDLDVNGRNIKFGHCSSSGSDDTLMFGPNGDDLKIFHSTNGIFSVNTGNAYFRNTGNYDSTRYIYLMARNDEQSVTCKSNDRVELYYDNSMKLWTQSWGAQCGGDFVPNGNNAYDLGASNERWRNLYTNDLNLSNEGSSNDIDGTWGDYTIQEGESDLFLKNNRSGKKYKFNLTEVS